VNQTGRSFEGLYITASDNKDWDAKYTSRRKSAAAGGKIQVRFRMTQNQEVGFHLVDDEGCPVTFRKGKAGSGDTVTLKDVER